MGYSFDFTSGKDLIIYQTENGEQLDEDICCVLRRYQLPDYIVSFEVENLRRQCRIYYDITNCTNMRAWMGMHDPGEQEEMQRKIMEARNVLIRSGIPKEMIEEQIQYMFVDDQTEGVRLLCRPLKTKKSQPAADSELPPLPDAIPVPEENAAGFDKFSEFNRHTQREQENWNSLETKEDWKNSERKTDWKKEDDTDFKFRDIQRVSDEDLYIPQRESSPQKTEPSFMQEETMEDEDDNETVLLHDPDNEATVLLKKTPPINARLIRCKTGEEFHINKEKTKIGKRAAVVDIYIRENKTISREHCMISFESGEYFLEDTNSLNHTYLNNRELEPGIPEKLENHSEIQMSDELFEFVIEEG